MSSAAQVSTPPSAATHSASLGAPGPPCSSQPPSSSWDVESAARATTMFAAPSEAAVDSAMSPSSDVSAADALLAVRSSRLRASVASRKNTKLVFTNLIRGTSARLRMGAGRQRSGGGCAVTTLIDMNEYPRPSNYLHGQQGLGMEHFGEKFYHFQRNGWMTVWGMDRNWIGWGSR